MPPNDTADLRVAVLGVGMMGAFHADALSHRIRGARVSVVSDFSAEKAQQVADRVGGSRCCARSR